ncbi:hypothetical protein V6N13_059551 [Hibiscus sabdariffa]
MLAPVVAFFALAAFARQPMAWISLAASPLPLFLLSSTLSQVCSHIEPRWRTARMQPVIAAWPLEGPWSRDSSGPCMWGFLSWQPLCLKVPVSLGFSLPFPDAWHVSALSMHCLSPATALGVCLLWRFFPLSCVASLVAFPCVSLPWSCAPVLVLALPYAGVSRYDSLALLYGGPSLRT